MRFGFLTGIVFLSNIAFAYAADLPGDPVNFQPARWRAVRHIIQGCAEQAGFRWAMPDTLSRRAWIGSNENRAQPCDEILSDLSRQTGLKIELLNSIVVCHAPNDPRRKELVDKIADKDAKVAQKAICELGWLSDAGAWPKLAQVACGDNLELALAAAHSLRRLEGEKPLDWRLFGVTQEDPEFVPMTDAVTQWQTPLGAAFPDSVAMPAIERLAKSTFLPLRETAARLTACQRAAGHDLAKRLVNDPSPLVRAAAERTLAAWAEPKRTERAPRKRDSKPWWELPAPDLTAAAEELAKNKDHDTVWRLTGRRVAYLGTPEAIRVMADYGRSGGRWSSHVAHALAEWCGGPDAIAYLKSTVASGDFNDGHHGWSLWGLSALQDGKDLAESLRPALLEPRSFWAAPPEYTAARGAGIYALDPLLGRLERRGHWVCLALGYIGGPEAADALIARLADKDPGVAVAAAKGLGDAAPFAGIQPLIQQLQHPDRLRRHWAALAVGRIGGPDATEALSQLLVAEESRRDRLVRLAAAQLIPEIAPPTAATQKLIDRALAEDVALVPEFRPRNLRFDESFPINTELAIKEHKPVTYCSIGETRGAMDWANRLLLRYGGCTGCYSNECFACDVGTATWFPIRAADHYCHLFNEVRPNAGCSRGMTYDGLNKLTWIGQAIGSSSGPTATTHNRGNGLGAYDAALDRFYPCANNSTMEKAYSGEPAKYFAFDYDRGQVVSSASGGLGIGELDAKTRKTQLVPAPQGMPSWDQYRPPAFAYDPLDKKILCVHPGLQWKLLTYDFATNTYQSAKDAYPGVPDKGAMGGLVWDSLNRELILVGGVGRESKQVMPTCRYDRAQGQWIDLQPSGHGHQGVGQGTCVYDPEHNVILEIISGAAYRYQNVPLGTRAYYGGPIGQPKAK